MVSPCAYPYIQGLSTGAYPCNNKISELGVTHLEFLYLKYEPQRAQSSRKDRKVF